MSEETFGMWAVLELMGHRRLTGYVTEETHFGVGVIRIDIHGADREAPAIATQWYSPSSLYCLTPTTEEIARAANNRPAPIQRWELPALQETSHFDDDDEDDFDDLRMGEPAY
jgi:hypothetical protein